MNILKPSFNQSLFMLVLLNQVLPQLDFLPEYVHFNGQKFRCVLEQLSFTAK